MSGPVQVTREVGQWGFDIAETNVFPDPTEIAGMVVVVAADVGTTAQVSTSFIGHGHRYPAQNECRGANCAFQLAHGHLFLICFPGTAGQLGR
jgi:hypothetical protein